MEHCYIPSSGCVHSGNGRISCHVFEVFGIPFNQSDSWNYNLLRTEELVKE